MSYLLSRLCEEKVQRSETQSGTRAESAKELPSPLVVRLKLLQPEMENRMNKDAKKKIPAEPGSWGVVFESDRPGEGDPRREFCGINPPTFQMRALSASRQASALQKSERRLSLARCGLFYSVYGS